MREIIYNSQRNNKTVKSLAPSVQCFATSAWMFLSFYAPEKYRGDDDAALSWFVGDVTMKAASDEFEWSAQAAMIQKYLDAAGVRKKVKLGIDLDTGNPLTPVDQLRALLTAGPVIVGTKKMGNLPGGHIILAIDNADDGAGVICHDPYGDARLNYSSADGASVVYPVFMFDAKYPAGPVRTLYAI